MADDDFFLNIDGVGDAGCMAIGEGIVYESRHLLGANARRRRRWC